LLGGGNGDFHLADEVGIARADAPHAARRDKFLGDHPHRDAAAAAFAGRPIGDRLAAAEAALGQDVVEFARPLADQMGKNLPLFLTG
jgi:hypothetical protein